jgi:hypothetical protein
LQEELKKFPYLIQNTIYVYELFHIFQSTCGCVVVCKPPFTRKTMSGFLKENIFYEKRTHVISSQKNQPHCQNQHVCDGDRKPLVIQSDMEKLSLKNK